MTVPLERVPGIPALARGLATGAPDVSEFLPRAATRAAVAAQAESVRRAFRPRSVAAGADARLALLARGARAAIATGQQAGLFGGPHLTLAKAVAAGRIAADLSAAGTPASAAFWCAAEDHDLVEVTRVVLPTPEGPRDFGPDPVPLAANRAPVGALPITADVSAILAAAAEGLGGEPDGEALAFLRDAHAGGSTYAGAFAKTLDWLLGGEMPLVDAADAAEKPALVPLAVRIVRERRKVRELLRTRDAELSRAGHPLQVKTDEAALPLFVRADGERFLLVEEAGSLALKGRAGAFPVDEVVARLESGAWLPSFSALTRPLAASVLYPVGATVLGPAEVAYWAQAWPLFEWAGIVPPAVLLRPLVALESPAARRGLEKLGVSLEDVLEGEEALLRKKGAGAASGLLARVAAIRDRARAELDAARADLLAVDPSLGKAIAATEEKLAFSFEKLVEKTESAAGRADALVLQQVRRLSAELLPDGKLAERLYPILPYVLKLGKEAVVTRPAPGPEVGRARPAGDRAVSAPLAAVPVDVLAFGPHPDDVELGCGGTLAALAARGRSFGIVDLTRGEMATRGTPELRAAEAAEAGRLLGARFRVNLDLGDGDLRTDRAAQLLVVEAVRRSRPRLVLAPLAEDRHPDHERAGRLVREASWYAGLAKLETGLAAHRPDQVVFYAAYALLQPTFLVDVSASFETKRAALRAYASQFHAPGAPSSGEPETYVSSKSFWDGVEARARAYGRIANVAYAEGFLAKAPPLLGDPAAAFAGYEGGRP